MKAKEKVSILPVEIRDYLRLMRPDHWFKNIFMLPGIILGLLLTNSLPSNFISMLCIGMISTSMVASANYTINEWLDREFDKHHPKKKNRPSVTKKLKASYVYILYIVCACLGLGLAFFVNLGFLYFSFILLIMGWIYNVRPLRAKERLYLDVLIESINNPLRFLLGWTIVVTHYLPPVSILIAYWMGGAFLMGMKRFAEYRYIGDPEVAGRYRRSFKYYTESNLLLSSFFYALTSAFFLGVFLIKYRIEYLVALPFLAVLFTWYAKIAFSVGSAAQAPEKLYREKSFMLYTVFLCLLVLALSFIDLPWLQTLLDTTLVKWE